MRTLRLEVGENQVMGTCSCCGAHSWTGHGFVYNNEEPFAVYYLGATDAHRGDGITMAVAIGAWSDDSTPDDRTCFGIEAREVGPHIDFQFLNGDDSPWGKTELLGEMISRSQALSHPAKHDILDIVEVIVSEHPAVRRFLNAEE